MHASATVKLQWSNFNNETGQKVALPALADNKGIPGARDGYFVADLVNPALPKQTISVYVRQLAGKPVIVGIDRAW